MRVPLEYSTRGLTEPEAHYGARAVQYWVDKIDNRRPDAIACRVAIDREPHTEGSRGPLRVRVELTMPPRPAMVAVRSAGDGIPGEGVATPVAEAFRKLEARIETEEAKRRRH